MNRLLAAMAPVGAAVLALTATPAAAADGGGSCSGKLLVTVPLFAGKTTIGFVRLYHNAAKRTACAITLHGGATAGVRADTGVLLAKSQPPSGDYVQVGYQRGNYVKQAGPVTADVTGRCFYAGGGITYRGKHYTLYSGKYCD